MFAMCDFVKFCVIENR